MIGCQQYENPDLQIRAGAGQILFIGGVTEDGSYSKNTYESQKGIEMLHDLAKKMLYRHANSNAMSVSRDYTPYWIAPVIIVNILLLGGALFLVLALSGKLKSKKKVEVA